jgi:hypothetical protein
MTITAHQLYAAAALQGLITRYGTNTPDLPGVLSIEDAAVLAHDYATQAMAAAPLTDEDKAQARIVAAAKAYAASLGASGTMPADVADD